MAVNEHDGHEEDARVARLYREAPREEPPAHLDRAIAAAALEGAGRRSAPATSSPGSWWAPWRLPVAFAALAVVSVSLVTLMIEEDRERVSSLPASPPPAAYEPEDAKIAQPPAEAAPPIAVPKAVERARLAQRQDDRKLEPQSVPETSSVPSPPVELPGSEAPAAKAGPRALQRAPALEAPPQAAQDPLPAATPRAGGDTQVPRAEDRRPVAPAPAPPAAKPTPAPMAKPAPAREAASEIRAQEPGRYALQARTSPEVARHLVDLDNKPPSAWIERVLTLRREGRITEADGLVVEFRRRFPGESLPAGLQ